MAISQEVTLDNDVTIKYIRVEFAYVMNTRNSKTVFTRIGLYVSTDSKKLVDYFETSKTWEELGYTGSENLFELIYNKLKEQYPNAIDV